MGETPKFNSADNNVEALSDWRTIRESASAWVEQQLGFALDAAPSLEKCKALHTLMNELATEMELPDMATAEKRVRYYAAEALAQTLVNDTEVLQTVAVAGFAERLVTPPSPSKEYLGKYQLVDTANRQPLSPAASDNRPANPVTMQQLVRELTKVA